jgi:hypothetical protein
MGPRAGCCKRVVAIACTQVQQPHAAAPAHSSLPPTCPPPCLPLSLQPAKKVKPAAKQKKAAPAKKVTAAKKGAEEEDGWVSAMQTRSMRRRAASLEA